MGKNSMKVYFRQERIIIIKNPKAIKKRFILKFRKNQNNCNTLKIIELKKNLQERIYKSKMFKKNLNVLYIYWDYLYFRKMAAMRLTFTTK